MVEVRKIMETAFKRSHARTAALSAPDPAAGHCRPTPPPEPPGHSGACVGQSPVEVWVNSGLLQQPELWVQQTWVRHKPSWRRSTLAPP